MNLIVGIFCKTGLKKLGYLMKDNIVINIMYLPMITSLFNIPLTYILNNE